MKTALVTGAAGGVGQALAQELLDAGYSLVLTDRDSAALGQIAKRIGGGAECIVGDLTSRDDLAVLCARIESTDNPIDLVINNAGIIVPKAVSDISDDVLRAHIDINLTAPMILCAAAARAMKSRGAGRIFSIISLAGIVPLKNSAAYSASKFGLRGFMAALSMELKSHGVYVGSLFPGAVDTAMLADEMASSDGSPMNFVGSADPTPPKVIAQAALKAMDKGKMETWLPRGDGRTGGLVMTFPSLLAPISAHLEKKGEKRKQAYLVKLADG